MSLIFALDSQIYLLSLLDGAVNEAIHARTKETFAIYAGAIECALLPRHSSPVGDDIRLAGICFETELVLLMNGRQRVQQLNDRGLSKILSERACRLSARDGAFRAIGRTSELQAGYRTLSPKIVGSGPRCFSDGQWLKRLFDRGILMNAPICLISGVGPGTGSALAKRFTEGGYRVALLARNEARLVALERKLVTAKGYPCDVSDPAQIDRVASQIERDLGSPSVVIHNAVGGAFGTFREIDPSILNRNFQVNTMGLLYLARRFSPAMIDSKTGAIVVTGNTSALRGKPSFAGFAPTKAAQRILAEAIARELGPKGVHVAYLVVDAVIDLAWTRERFKDRPDEFFVKPMAIAEEIWHVVHQDRSAWSFNVELRPFGETW